MNTIEKIKEEYTLIQALTGNTGCYQNSVEFLKQESICDVYFNSEKGELLQSQIDNYNEFERNYQKYLPQMNDSFLPYFSSSDQQRIQSDDHGTMSIDIIEIPFDNSDYDLLVVCSRKISKFLFFRKEVCLHFKIKNEKITSVERKKYTNV